MRYATHWLGALYAALWFSVALTPCALAQTPAENALTVYEQGKKLYDTGDFAGARSRFIDAIRIEPDNPRWHYNLGLVHRQLENLQAARQSLLKARELNPDYKRTEIDQKLASMGFATAPTTAAGRATEPGPRNGAPEEIPISDDEALSFVLWLVAGVFALVIGFIGLVFWLIRRNSGSASMAATPKSKSTSPPPDAKEIDAIRQRLDAAAQQLIRIEHALRLGEQSDLRSQLDHATRLEQALRNHLDEASAGDTQAFRKAHRAIEDLEASTDRALHLAEGAFGDQAFADQGDKIACYFCARPLANAEYRRKVAMKRGETKADVLSCPVCAQAAAKGEAPGILTAGDGSQHWSELPDFDPYAARHSALDHTKRVPAWRFAPQRSLGELALLAGGAALAGGAVASMWRPGEAEAAEPLLDLDAARESGIAQEAASAAAVSATGQRSERFTDHS